MNRALSIAAAALLSLAACFPVGPLPCTDLAAFGLNVIVTDATSGEAICDATVTATDGTFEEELQVQGTGADCVYVGAVERAGTYRVEAAKDGFDGDVEEGVVVDADECHVIGEQVALELAVQLD